MIYLGNQAVGINNTFPDFEELSKYTIMLQLIYEENSLPDSITIDCAKLRYLSFPSDWTINSGLKHVILKNIYTFETSTAVGLSTAAGIVRLGLEPNRGIESIDFSGSCEVSGQMYHFFNYWYNLKTIYGSLDFSKVTEWTYGSWFAGNTTLEQINFVPNSALNVSILNFENLQNINDASLISIGNLCLANPSNTRTLKLHSSKKTRCTTLIGRNDNGLFIADENGTLSLYDFITTVKGWTIT